MAKCALTLRLDEQKEVYLPGDLVRGTLEATVNDAVKCNGLKVGLRWRVHGKGDSEYEEIVSETLFEGEWRAGTVWTGRFELALPAGPYTYYGHYLNVVWEVFARADIPWAIDPKTEVEIALKPDPAKAPDWSSAVGSTVYIPSKLRKEVSREPAAPARLGYAGKALGWLILVIIGVAIWSSLQIKKGNILALGLVLVVIPIFLRFKEKLARKRLGAVILKIDPKLVRAGGEINASVSCKPDKATELRAATARLIATEVVERGSGTNKTTFRQVVYEEDFELTPARTLPPGIPFQAGTSIPIPASAPPSFYASKNKLSWEVVVHVDIARWPDWRKATAILVHP